MFDTKVIDDVARRLAELLPPGVRDLQNDVEKNFRATLQTAFTKLELVTREEFDVQSQVLSRTRAKLEALEKRVSEMEQKQGVAPAAAEPAA